MTRCVVLSPAPAGRYDGIGDYASRLAAALQGTLQASLHVTGAGHFPDAGNVDAVFHQYSPAAPAGPVKRDEDRWLDALSRAGRPVIVTVHEYWPPGNGSPGRALRRFTLRRRVRRSAARASAVIVTQEISATQLGASGVLGSCPVHVVPVGSNITPVASASGPRDGGLVLFGQPAAMNPQVMRALARSRAETGARDPLTWISRSADEARNWWAHSAGGRPADVNCLGAVPEADVSMHLHKATLGLAPYADGASARRTTLAALMQHGVPTLALDGIATDGWLRRQGGLAWVADADPDAFVPALETLMADGTRRAVLSTEARHAYDTHMSWPAIAQAYVRALESGKQGSR